MEESIWIYNQLVAGVVPLFKKKDGGTSDEEKELPIDKDDIMRFLDLMHAQKFDVSAKHLLGLKFFLCMTYETLQIFALLLGPVHCHVPQGGMHELI